MQEPAKRFIVIMDYSHVKGYGTPTPSEHQRGDTVQLNLINSGHLKNCKVVGVLFKSEGVSYDIDVPISTNAAGDILYRRWPAFPGGLVEDDGYFERKAEHDAKEV